MQAAAVCPIDIFRKRGSDPGHGILWLCKFIIRDHSGYGYKYGSSAFENCTLLGSVTIPAAVDTISDTAFAGCSNLSSVEVDGGNATYSSYDGCIYNKTQTKLLYCPEGKYSVKISDKTSTLSYAALNGCYGITEVTLPASVTVIEQNAFFKQRRTDHYHSIQCYGYRFTVILDTTDDLYLF